VIVPGGTGTLPPRPHRHARRDHRRV